MNIIRNPGEYLEKENQKISLELVGYGAIILIFPSILVGLSLANIINKPILNIFSFFLVITSIILSFYFLTKTKKIKNNIENNIKGKEGEKIVATILDKLKSQYKNFFVLNDIQTKKIGNFDHIIISEKGIFVIETKNHKNINIKRKNRYYKKLKSNSVKLKEHLEKKFDINYIQGILVYINGNIKEQKNNII